MRGEAADDSHPRPHRGIPPNPFRIVSILRHLISPPLKTTKHHGFHTQMPQVLEEQTHIWEHVAWRDWQNVENQGQLVFS